MSKAKDFQQATAKRIIEIFRSGQKRVLLSDEVGLGKTIMARTVVEMAKSLPGIEDDGIYRVVYVCSNQNIIQQNTRNLGIPKEDIMQMRESRLSMQHLILQERKIEQEARHGTTLPQQLIPLTPSTSFSITGGAGNGAERALIFAILKENCDEQYEDFLKLMRFLFREEAAGRDSFHTVWEDYSNKLSHISSEAFDALVISKQKAEDKMYKAVCRTERYSEGLVKTMPLEKMTITGDDILAYCQIETIVNVLQSKIQERIDALGLPTLNVTSADLLLTLIQRLEETELRGVPQRAARTTI